MLTKNVYRIQFKKKKKLLFAPIVVFLKPNSNVRAEFYWKNKEVAQYYSMQSNEKGLDKC